MKTLYTTRVHVGGGRDGRAISDDRLLDIALAMPEAIGGLGRGTNPEQLFAAGFAACFSSSIRFVAKARGLEPGDVDVGAVVSLTVDESGAYGIEVTLAPRLPGLSGPARDEVLAEAKRICAYSNALRGTVPIIQIVEEA